MTLVEFINLCKEKKSFYAFMEFCMSEGIQLNSDQISQVKEIFNEEIDNSKFDTNNTNDSSQADNVVDASKDDDTQSSKDPDQDESTIKNEAQIDNSKLQNVTPFNVKVLDSKESLPENADSSTIYIVPSEEDSEEDEVKMYDEFIYNKQEAKYVLLDQILSSEDLEVFCSDLYD